MRKLQDRDNFFELGTFVPFWSKNFIIHSVLSTLFTRSIFVILNCYVAWLRNKGLRIIIKDVNDTFIGRI